MSGKGDVREKGGYREREQLFFSAVSLIRVTSGRNRERERGERERERAILNNRDVNHEIKTRSQ